MNSVEKWNIRHGNTAEIPSPALVLAENRHLLPPRGRALDLACGLGSNALLLAEQGLETLAWDSSPVAIERLRALATKRSLPVRGEVRDVEKWPPPADSFDVIVVCHFLERTLAPFLAKALRPNGLLFYQTWTRTRVDESGPDDPLLRLQDNELLILFSDLTVRIYREEGSIGDITRGFRNKAMLVAQRPSGSTP